MRAVLLLLTLTALGCDSGTESASSDVIVTDQAILSLDETTVIDGVTVTFLSVKEDSRCPPDSMCVWQGIALVTLDLDGTPQNLYVGEPEQDSEGGVQVGDVRVFASDLSWFGEPVQVTVVTAR